MEEKNRREEGERRVGEEWERRMRERNGEEGERRRGE
jgi:hypothetical protein